MTPPNQCPKCGAERNDDLSCTGHYTQYECRSVRYPKEPFDQSQTCRIRELEKDRDHWKAAHDEMVAHNKLLRNRPDLPLERVTGYDEIMQQLAAERAKVAKLREALQDAVAGVWDGHYGRGITADYARTVDAKAREALEETR